MLALREQLAHRPAELAPLEGEQHDRLLRIVEQAPHELLRFAVGSTARADRAPSSGACARLAATARRRVRELELLRGHLLGDAVEQRRAQVALARVGQHARAPCPRAPTRTARARPRSVAPPEMPVKMPSFRASSRESRIASPPSTGTMRSTSFCASASSVSFGMKSGVQPWTRCGRKSGWLARRRAVALARLRDAAAEHRRVVRLAQHDLRLGPVLAQHARDALERAAGAGAGHPVVEPLAREVRRGSRAPSCASERRRWLRSRTAGTGTSRAPRQLGGLGAACRCPSSRPGVSTTLAPRKRISLRRSTLKFSAMTITSG